MGGVWSKRSKVTRCLVKVPRTKVKASETSTYQWSHTEYTQKHTKKKKKLYLFKVYDVIFSYKLFLLFTCSVVSDSLQPHGLQHSRFPCSSPSPRVCSNSCPFSRWCHPTITSSVVPFYSHLQSFPASGSFLMSQLFTSGDQSIGTLASVLLKNIQDWFPLGLTGLISLKSKGLSRVFSNTTVQKHQFFGPQLSLWSNSHIHTWPLKKP